MPDIRLQRTSDVITDANILSHIAEQVTCRVMPLDYGYQEAAVDQFTPTTFSLPGTPSDEVRIRRLIADNFGISGHTTRVLIPDGRRSHTFSSVLQREAYFTLLKAIIEEAEAYRWLEA